MNETPSPGLRIMRFFDFKHLTDDRPRTISGMCCSFAQDMYNSVPDGPEKTTGLRKLLEAKDCFVRASLKE